MGTAFLGSLLEGSDFLATVALHQNRLLAAARFQLLAAFTSAAIAVTRVKAITQSDLDDVAAELNDRPRQTLGWKTPCQALDEALR